MVVNFEVGKTYRYNGKTGDPSPFLAINIDEQDALFIVSGEPLVCTYVEEDCHCPGVGFKGMGRENGGWAFGTLYHLFDEVEGKTVAEEKQKEEKKEMPKFEVGKTYRYTGSSDSASDFITIGIYDCDAEHIASGEPLTVEFSKDGNRIKFKEFRNPWRFLDAMLEKFEEVPASSSEVDREKKYAESEKRYHELEDVAESDGYEAILEVMRTSLKSCCVL